MFNKSILGTTLTGEAADRLFSNITDYDAPDQSFLATLRALLRKRLPPDKTVHLSCKKIYLSVNEITNMTVSQCMGRFLPVEVTHQPSSGYNISGYNIFIVHTTTPDAGEKMLEIMRTNAGVGKRNMTSYTLREDLRVFYARTINALFYTDTNERNTVIFTDKLELKHFHILQMMIPKYLPLLFTDSLTDWEVALLKSTGNKSAVDYETMIGEFAKDIDIRAEIIRTKLEGFETAFERLRVSEIRNEINRHQNDYNSYLSLLRELSQKIQNCQYTLAGLECAINNHAGDSELMEYFMCNKNLNLIQVTGTTMEFVSHGYADVYDVDAFEKYVENHNGYLYNNISSAVTKTQMEKLYRAIFGDCRYKLRLCAAYTADMRTGLIAYKYYNFPPESINYLPNPHIQKFGCIGDYASRFHEYMQKKDYVGAIDQAVVSGRNLNFYDSTVMSNFAQELSCTIKKCIEKSDGTLITPLEAINELEGGETECPDPLF